ncbi:MAG: hypothetical protein ACLFTH_01220 [Candidatus Woesearchaeota archaeon]
MDDKLHSFIERFTSQIPFEPDMVIKEQGAYFEVPERIRDLVARVRERPSNQGLFLGREKDGIFRAGTALLERIAPITNRKVVLNSKASWLFVCGRDVFEKNILPQSTDATGLVLVLDEDEEVLGLAKADKKKGMLTYTNITDIGQRLRREWKK